MGLNVLGNDSLEMRIYLNDQSLEQTIKAIEGKIEHLTDTANRGSRSMEGIAKNAALAIGSYLSLNVATDFAKQIIDVRSQFQSLEISFNTMLGSKEKATALMGDIIKLAALTPFSLQDVATGAKQLLAYGFAADKTVDTLRTLGDVASGVQAPIGDLVYLYGTLRTQGIAYTKDIREFTGRGIPIIQELAKQFGLVATKTETAEQQVSKLVEAGKVGFPQVEAAFKNLTGAGGKFFNLMEQQSKTLSGQITNLKDKFSQMLGAIGQSQEGIITNSISGLNTLVDNYETVLDIIKSLVLTYGAYRAVLALTVVTQRLQETAALQAALAGQTLTKSQLAAATATRVLDGTFKTLYATVASAAPVLALAAVTAAIYAMATTSDAAADALNKIKDIQVEGAQAAATEKAKIEELLVVYNDRTKSEEDHATALRKIIDLNPKYLGGLNANNAATAEGKNIIANYLKALDEKATGEAAYAAKQANLLKIIELQTKGIAAVDPFERLGFSLKRFVTGKQDLSGTKEGEAIVSGMIKDLNTANEKITNTFKTQLQKSVLGDSRTSSDIKNKEKRSLSVIEAEIKAIKEKQTAESASSEQYLKFQRQINNLEKEAEGIRGKTKSQIKAQQTEENKINDVLENRKSLLEDLAALHRDAVQSGLTKEASEVDKINEKYDETLKKIDEFNKKNPKNKISTITIQEVGGDRATEIANAQFRQQAEDYKKHLDQQKDVFTQFEEAKKEIGVERATEMFNEQARGFSSFLEYLKSERNNLLAQQAGGFNIGIDAKLKANAEQTIEEEKRVQKEVYENYKRLLTATQTFSDQRKNIEVKYLNDIEILQKNFKGEDLKTREAILRKSHEIELVELENNIARQSALYQKLNEDILRYTREQLKERKSELQKILKTGEYFDKDKDAFLPLTPAMIADINSALGTTNGLLSDTKKIAGLTKEEFAKVVKDVEIAASALHSLGDAFSGINSEISGTLNQLGDYAEISLNVVKGITTGDPQSIINAITGTIKLFADARQSRIQAQKDTEAFQTAQFTGELEINATYRERLRTQKDINELKLDGLKKETALLATQKTAVADQYKNILSLIQKQSFVSGTTEQRGRFNPLTGLVGLLTRRTSTVNAFDSLSGKTYEDLEKLFTSGQLDEKAKALFEQLKKLKQEGIDIDAALEENKRKAAEVFTGTTADSITDMIVDGFANGFKSVQDFAGKTEDIIRKALLSALRYQGLEGPIKKLYEQFAIDAESGGVLDLSEINSFNEGIKNAIETAQKMAEQLEKASGISLSAANAATSPNSVTGALKSLTEETGGIIAGNIGGLRLTSIEALGVARAQLNTLNKIENNTSLIKDLVDYNRKFDTLGIKIRA